MPETAIKYSDHQLMRVALSLAQNSKDEDDSRVHPKVGSVIARDGYILSTGYRGELYLGAHAEECAMSKIDNDASAGATLFTTLEPCPRRGKLACSQLLTNRRIKRVVIGILHPDPCARGQGEWSLESAGISIGKFEAEYVAQIKAQNATFIDYMLGIGLTILYPSAGQSVPREALIASGKYRVQPRCGDPVIVFTRTDFTYYPQAPISWDSKSRMWNCEGLWFTAGEKQQSYGIVIARVSEDFGVWLKSYVTVHRVTGKWIGAEMPTLPSGFEILASVPVILNPKAAGYLGDGVDQRLSG